MSEKGGLNKAMVMNWWGMPNIVDLVYKTARACSPQLRRDGEGGIISFFFRRGKEWVEDVFQMLE